MLGGAISWRIARHLADFVLTAPKSCGFAGAMGRTMHRIVCFFMVAVVFAAGAINGAFACTDVFATGGDMHIAAHDHGDHELHDHAAREFGANAIPADDTNGAPSVLDCDGCPHIHVHCCASTAMPAGDYGLKLVFSSGLPMPEEGSLLPLGQLSYPLLRPPRAA